MKPTDGVRSSSDSNAGKLLHCWLTGDKSQLTEAQRRALSEGADSAGYAVPRITIEEILGIARAGSALSKAGARTVPLEGESDA